MLDKQSNKAINDCILDAIQYIYSDYSQNVIIDVYNAITANTALCKRIHDDIDDYINNAVYDSLNNDQIAILNNERVEQ